MKIVTDYYALITIAYGLAALTMGVLFAASWISCRRARQRLAHLTEAPHHEA